MIVVDIPRLSSVHEAFERFGRVGILIDDVHDASSRLATELYATETLPAWWILARTIAHGSELVEQLLNLPLPRVGARPFIVVVDRYLPLRSKSPAISWWGASKDSRANILRTSIIKLREMEEHGVVIGVSAFPTLVQTDKYTVQPEELRWHSRSDAAVLRLVRGHETNVTTKLLTFGPRKHANERWTEAISTVVNLLGNSNEKVVLLTGAGMSRRSSDVGAGMLDNNQLMAAAVQWALRKNRFKPVEEPRNAARQWRDDVTSWEQVDSDYRDTLRDDQSNFAKAVCAFVDNGALRWPKAGATFNTMWGKLRHDSGPDVRVFRRDVELGIRVIVTANDRGITHQHFLAAQLPFDLVVTTNFDGQHERAAVLAASRDSSHAPEHISRGMSVEIMNTMKASPTVGSANADASGSVIEQRLLRLYGSVASGQRLALEPTQFASSLETFSTEIGKLSPKPTLVIVGHSLDDVALIAKLLEAKFDKIFYVALGASKLVTGKSVPRKHQLKSQLLQNATILDCRAIDFFFDLSAMYHSS